MKFLGFFLQSVKKKKKSGMKNVECIVALDARISEPSAGSVGMTEALDTRVQTCYQCSVRFVKNRIHDTDV